MTTRDRRVEPPGDAGRDQGMAILSYLIAGICLYGGLGWLADHLLHTAFLLPVGMLAGLAVSIYLIIKRYGSVP
ncbi:MAG: hypothetical protein WBL05_11090 [Brooklawnia sp.]|uniref:AtpZ/AtpI family protein n=1 Tax=Brooklawnia sp. TaxID=2699740 RepID=UPI003C71D38E